jgi:hypothetical protein
LKNLLEKIDDIAVDARKLHGAIASLNADFDRTRFHPDSEIVRKKWQDLVEYLIDTAEEANEIVRKGEGERAF